MGRLRIMEINNILKKKRNTRDIKDICFLPWPENIPYGILDINVNKSLTPTTLFRAASVTGKETKVRKGALSYSFQPKKML